MNWSMSYHTFRSLVWLAYATVVFLFITFRYRLINRVGLAFQACSSVVPGIWNWGIFATSKRPSPRCGSRGGALSLP